MVKLSTNIKCNTTNSDSDTVSYYIFLSSQVILGVGTAVFWTCGVTYLDDNVRKNVVPMLLGAYENTRLF